VLFISILYAVYRFDTERQARQNLLEREMQSAREIQELLIPEAMSSLEGYAVTSAYRPALEVGGDFFQIMRRKNSSAIVALGDVSGKGLRAAMSVSLIVGILRSLSEASYGPAQVLQILNRCLYGRLQNGFVTAVILQLQTNGMVTIANAGHLPPFLNDKELAVEGSLPLGLSPALAYEESSLHLQEGDQLSIYTDGLLEARNSTGELYGFERLHTLFAMQPTAQQVTEAAIAFGQNDDITVLTITRLAEGEEATTSVTASFAKSDIASFIELQ
jgi:serine phosphatase RsbU (regulator of sigma subunit)